MNNNEKSNIINLAQRMGKQPSADSVSAALTETLIHRTNEMMNLMNVLFLNDRVIKRILIDKGIVSQTDIDSIFDDEVAKSNAAVELIQMKVSCDEKLKRAVQQGIPMELMNPISLISFDREMSFDEKMDLAIKYELKEVVKFLEANKAEILNLASMTV